MDMTEDPDAILSVEDALKTLYIRTALVAERLTAQHPSYFHLVKAEERLARAWRAALAERVERN